MPHGEAASRCKVHGGGEGLGGGGEGGEGGDGGGKEGGGRGGKMTWGAETLSALASTPRLLASDEVTALELSELAVAAAASEAEPSIVMLMVTEVDVTIGVATVTLCPRALPSESVRALVSSAASVALELRLSPELAGMVISKVICVLCSRRPPSSLTSDSRRPLEPSATVQPDRPAQTLA